MIIYTIGFTQKSAEQFFETIKSNKIELVIDIRLNNRSQLAGFSKGSDLIYFLKEICNCKYIHCEEYAPTKELLSDYQKKFITWDNYTYRFNSILDKRKDYLNFTSRFSCFDRVCLLCSEALPVNCHRKLLAEKIQSVDKTAEIIHL